MDNTKHPRDYLALALDNTPDLDKLKSLIHAVREHIGVAKIGLEQFTRFGPSALSIAREAGARIFLDLKFHDIPNTVHQAVLSAAALGVDYLTIHTQGGAEMMRAAAKAAQQSGDRRPKIVGVTVLTSISESALRDELGVQARLSDHVRSLALLAADCGLDGIVCSAADLPAIRPDLPREFEIVTPGIRLPEGSAHDQKRVATPSEAIRNGATLLVIGRAVTEAKDPELEAERIASAVSSAEGDVSGA